MQIDLSFSPKIFIVELCNLDSMFFFVGQYILYIYSLMTNVVSIPGCRLHIALIFRGFNNFFRHIAM